VCFCLHQPLADPFGRHVAVAECRESKGLDYEHRPDKARTVYALKGVFVGILMAFIGAVLAHQTETAPAELILTGLLTGAIVLMFGWLLPALTSKGVRTLAKVPWWGGG
jgi:hypothetical protein